ncbi:Eco57I restriction-modification methylase domain-containing protein, partial [uncultured Parvimonas sp.]|uniref:Eco57I restriction-modification methylase domain-containing protein n=1 Tax=uncultured Parvimonas sp. TaxID=747372 RepID=UPI00325FA586
EIFANGGFDIVVGNPPYVKEYTAKSAFNGLHNHEIYQGKMDLWYFFGWLGLNISKNNSYISYIAPNNWITNTGASKFRNYVLDNSKILEYIDFGDYKVFEDAGIQTMIYLMKNTKNNKEYTVNYLKLNDKNLSLSEVQKFIRKENFDGISHFTSIIKREECKNNYILFLDNFVNNILKKIEESKEFYLEKEEIAQGIVPNPDVINSRNILKISDEKVKKYDIKIGDGVFTFEKNYLKNLSEKEKNTLKPLYEPENFKRYSFNNKNNKVIIYLNKKIEDEENYRNILGHLEKYREIMDERRENLSGSREFYQLHWGRDISFFEKGIKIISLRKCVERPVFSYTSEEVFVMLSFNVIKTKKIDMKKLVAILNSKLIKFWLLHRGKMQGDIFQVDKEPLLEIPLKTPSDKMTLSVDKMLSLNKELQEKVLSFQRLLTRKFELEKLSTKLQDWYLLDFSEFIKELKKAKIKLSLKDEMEWEEIFLEKKEEAEKVKNEIEITDKEIDGMVYELYGLNEEEIRIVES